MIQQVPAQVESTVIRIDEALRQLGECAAMQGQRAKQQAGPRALKQHAFGNEERSRPSPRIRVESVGMDKSAQVQRRPPKPLPRCGSTGQCDAQLIRCDRSIEVKAPVRSGGLH